MFLSLSSGFMFDDILDFSYLNILVAEIVGTETEEKKNKISITSIKHSFP